MSFSSKPKKVLLYALILALLFNVVGASSALAAAGVPQPIAQKTKLTADIGDLPNKLPSSRLHLRCQREPNWQRCQNLHLRCRKPSDSSEELGLLRYVLFLGVGKTDLLLPYIVLAWFLRHYVGPTPLCIQYRFP